MPQLNIERITVGALGTNCYIVNLESPDCVVIDPADEAEKILTRVKELGLNVKAVILTHGHFDHTAGAGKIQKDTGAPVYIASGDADLLVNPGWMTKIAPPIKLKIDEVVQVKDGDQIVCGDLQLKIFETPGHSEGSISIYSPGYLFCGDLLFRGSVGRTDLPGGNWDVLLCSLREKILTLPDDTKVFPGHGPQTTIGKERLANPFIK